MLYALILAELLLSSSHLPHADATDVRAYSDLRPATAHLVAAAREAESADLPAGRFLSISKTLFEPGDHGEIEGIYSPVLSPDALWAYLVAAKQREVLSPNLPLAFGVPAVDGYDGGLLPLHHYAAFSRLLLPEGTLDGRLRENLEAIPDGRWLSLLDVRFLITDKVGDLWVDDIFYDRQFQPALVSGKTLSLAWLPADFEATALGVLYTGAGEAELTFDDETTLVVPLPANEAGEVPRLLHWEVPATLAQVTLRAGDAGLHPTAAALIDTRTGGFYPLVLSEDFRLAHSGDVKLYENVQPLPRAFVVHQALAAAEDEAALQLMAQPDFDPAHQAVIAAEEAPIVAGEGTADAVQILTYQSSRVVVGVRMQTEGLLVLSDSWYPGWKAVLTPLIEASSEHTAPVLRTDLLFRGVVVPAGEWRVTFTYRPTSLYWGVGLTVLGILGWVVFYVRKRHA